MVSRRSTFSPKAIRLRTDSLTLQRPWALIAPRGEGQSVECGGNASAFQFAPKQKAEALPPLSTSALRFAAPYGAACFTACPRTVLPSSAAKFSDAKFTAGNISVHGDTSLGPALVRFPSTQFE